MSSPFGTSLRRDPSDPRRLRERIDSFVRERLQSAIDDACLDVLVQVRRAASLPLPVPESAADRAAFDELIIAFLGHLEARISPALAAEEQGCLKRIPTGELDETARLASLQVELAKLVPDYWRRFEAVRVEFAADRLEATRRRPGLLGRLLRRQ